MLLLRKGFQHREIVDDELDPRDLFFCDGPNVNDGDSILHTCRNDAPLCPTNGDGSLICDNEPLQLKR